MGHSTSKSECPVCGDCEPALYLMKDSPYICTQCDTEWDRKTYAVLKRGVIGPKRPTPKELDELCKLHFESVLAKCKEQKREKTIIQKYTI